MNELDDHGELDVPVAVVAQRAGGEQHQQWPKPLAAAADDVFGDLIYEDDVGCEASSNGAIDGGEIAGDEILYGGEIDERGSRRGGERGRCHRQSRERLRAEYILEGAARPVVGPLSVTSCAKWQRIVPQPWIPAQSLPS